MTQEESMWCKQVDYNNGWPVLPEMSTPSAAMVPIQALQWYRFADIIKHENNF